MMTLSFFPWRSLLFFLLSLFSSAKKFSYYNLVVKCPSDLAPDVNPPRCGPSFPPFFLAFPPLFWSDQFEKSGKIRRRSLVLKFYSPVLFPPRFLSFLLLLTPSFHAGRSALLSSASEELRWFQFAGYRVGPSFFSPFCVLPPSSFPQASYLR